MKLTEKKLNATAYLQDIYREVLDLIYESESWKEKDKDLRYAIEKLLDIAEECMPRYSSSDTIAEILDIHKKYYDKE